jgi:hypothetical protein
MRLPAACWDWILSAAMLTDREREAWLLVNVDGATSEPAGRALGISTGAVRQLNTRAWGRLLGYPWTREEYLKLCEILEEARQDDARPMTERRAAVILLNCLRGPGELPSRPPTPQFDLFNDEVHAVPVVTVDDLLGIPVPRLSAGEHRRFRSEQERRARKRQR